MKIYTRKGDKGETGLIGGVRLLKSALRVEAYGEVDELNAILGWIRAKLTDETIRAELLQIQRDLFAVGAQLADPTGHVEQKAEKAGLHEGRVRELEGIIDRYDTVLSPLRAFILPGGSEGGALLHLARTVCRRAERRMVALSRDVPLSPVLITYINRLSDLLFTLARAVNRKAGIEEIPW
ncbi:cob(I)yrinic acid a,c-diamide adenosyltransferase [Candidatus Methylomirabilis sp.]|uniref:cob(I)yrinic acid a,c-diamide adenosyltransferase n=1 Tax=Candidatus Methylomirabilis sp. TaxID=2032687 RepID=UPI002A633C01|nr:cob(I)yrinic acid a,c-diamide adenosyltransferase [Candidatus Methylomirabilis sp.]